MKAYSFIQFWKGVLIATLVGLAAVLIETFAEWPILDPLVIAMVIGISLRSFIKFDDDIISGFKLAPSLFIPIGVIFYGAVSLNFTSFIQVDPNYIFTLFIVFIVYIVSGLFLSSVFRLNEKVGYLITAGSAICGASAIAITTKAIDADSDDVSVSLIVVFLSALIGLFIVLPVVASVFNLSELDYAIFSGVVMQFTGFVKAAVSGFSEEVKMVALSVKAVRYVGLLFLIPLFASFSKGKLTIPWYLFAFLAAGIIFTLMPDLAKVLKPAFKIILNVLWSIAMGAIGLNANLKKIFTKSGIKAFAVSFLAFIVAVITYVVSVKCL
ncbi:MAG: putative sulfate exporter family transporter [Candidatus Omnitrophica bacterium]|nr:putative sulfate exporter family transporter [Candidatus Omnitrophota bacterium]MBU1995901.1 putative sulfate exporter family transporter [Candidatus Omnitrophota bacterium]